MSLKRAILQVAHRESLVQMVGEVGLTEVDRRSQKQLATALARSRRARAERLVQCLSDEEVREACQVYEVQADGEREELVQRLLIAEAYRASGSEIALYTTGPFVALEVLTADNARDSACAIRAVRIEGSRMVSRREHLVRPPRRRFSKTEHGITWKMVASQPRFAQVWEQVAPIFDGASLVAAHNAPFTRSVVLTCCGDAGVQPPRLPYQCTMRLARRMWKLPSGKAHVVSTHLGLGFNAARPDLAKLSAQVVLAARDAARARA